MSIIESLLETQEFATLPPVAAKLLNILHNDNVNVKDIAVIIETDPSLTLKLLRVANSPLYATRTEINSISQAVVTLGLNRISNIVLGVSIFSRFLLRAHSNIAELMQKFWWHSSCTGMVAKSLAHKIKKNYKETEFIGGLVHDIGKLAMLQFDAQKYKSVVDLVVAGSMDVEAEQKIFGISHTEVGMEIAKLWKLPDEMTTIITNHTHPAEAKTSKDLVAVVRLADVLCEMWGADFYEGFRAVDIEQEESWKVLCATFVELNNMDVEQFTFELETEFRRSTDFLNLMVSDK
ncbi:MAG: HDOD domain-containing protein [Candidatus Kapabacteria bacterium]|nr:HDOD domain-containing protein [Candidatus Kapabacteria bacterium]